MTWNELFSSARPRKGSAGPDVLAGVQLAAMAVPQSLGYAIIAGMPPITGLYTLLLPLIGFAAFGSSRYLVVAADSATAAILAGGLSGIALSGSARYVALASVVALITALLLSLARILKLGFIADFLSQTVLTGFLTGVGFQVAIGVLGPMAGLNTTEHRTPFLLAELAKQLPRIHWPSVALAAVTAAGIFAIDRMVPRTPGPLVAVLVSISASAVGHLSSHGIAVIGPVTSGFPHPALAAITPRDIEALLPVALSCFVMIVTQSAATARGYALSHGEPLDENADLTGIGVANALAAFSGTFVVNGSPTQTAVVEGAGAKSQLAQVTGAVVIGLVLLFFTSPLRYLPRPVLGAIVFVVAVRLIRLRELRDIRRESPGEFVLAAVTAAVVVILGVEQGIVLAMVMSLLRIVQHSYRPHTGVLVQTSTDTWSEIPALPGSVTEPGLVVYRFSAPLFYANVGRFAEQVRGLATGAPTPVRWILVDAGPITRIDFSAARIVRQLMSDLERDHVKLVLAHVEPELKADLDRHNLTRLLGSDRILDRLHDAIKRYREGLSTA